MHSGTQTHALSVCVTTASTPAPRVLVMHLPGVDLDRCCTTQPVPAVHSACLVEVSAGFVQLHNDIVYMYKSHHSFNRAI